MKFEATAMFIEAVIFALPREKGACSKHVAATAKQNASRRHRFMDSRFTPNQQESRSERILDMSS